MNRTIENTRRALKLACAFAFLAGAAIPTAQSASITLKNGTGALCTITGTTATPAGDITYTVDCGGGGGTGPVCQNNTQNILTNTSATVTANCTNGPTAFSWAGPGLYPENPPTSASTTLGPFPDGTWTYTLTASNAYGSTTATYTINVSGNPVSGLSCAPTILPNPVTAGGSATLTANCTNAVSVNWSTSSAGAPAPTPSQATQSLTFPTAGTYTYSVTGTSSTGATGSGGVTVTVNAGGGGDPIPGNCPAVSNVVGTAINGSVTYDTLANLRWDLKPSQIGTKNWTYTGGMLRLSATGATISETPKGTWAQYSISTCPGTFDPPSAPSGCTFWSSSGGTEFQIGDGTSCPLTVGSAYYVNIRFVTGWQSTTQASCAGSYGYCTNYLKFN